ncbi:MAG: Long-chain-fatty-acid--CoA ligase [Alphaproteobacteria bacterium MarineAlpha2_Bin1]|nr:MAG: Long-chain-fatty-acid--CoA ligase [Alphaproteobacteria bacterium MarineAlpha2_Bin1]
MNYNEKNIFEYGLNKCDANYQPLSPITFLERTAFTFPNKKAIIYDKKIYTYDEFFKRCKKLASALLSIGVRKGSTISILCPNTPPMLEAHYAVPMSKGVLNCLNIRLDAKTLSFIIDHSETKILIYDTEFAELVEDIVNSLINPITLICIEDILKNPTELKKAINYEDFINNGQDNFDYQLPDDEWDAISLNYTSGTTGNPKGVVYHHRGAYLQSIGNHLAWNIRNHPIYLWTLPMFHCNGWCFPWTISIGMGTHICIRKLDIENIFNLIIKHKVSHLCGAPIVLNMIANAKNVKSITFKNKIHIATAAAPPPSTVIKKIEELGFEVTHLYGLTETYGPSVVNEWDSNWNDIPTNERSRIKARQGVKYQTLENLAVIDPKTFKPIPFDGKTIGEVMFRGNVVMKGYLKNSNATSDAFSGGWFHSGDLGVTHPDGYIELKDRSKDVIISGGENISSIELEEIISQNEAVLEVAVVGKNDEKWGEVPCAFIKLKKNKKLTEDEIIKFCYQNMARYKVPKKIIFADLPKTSTGKIQKYKLRDQIK